MCNTCTQSKSNFLEGLEGYSLNDADIFHGKTHELAKKKERPTHPCHECNGTGNYKGVRVHQEKQHCFACKGKGYFYQSYADRMKARDKARQRKVNALAAKQEAFTAQHEGLIEALRGIASWHQFAGKLIADFDKYGQLTENQAAAAKAALLKVEAKRAERDAAKAAKSGDVSVETVVTLFARAKSRGAKKPKFTYQRLVLSAAPEHGKNPGAIYVDVDGQYSGKIIGGKFFALNSAPAETLTLLNSLPKTLEEAVAYGKESGICACCGRALTDPKSVAMGIGPVCAEKWF